MKNQSTTTLGSTSTIRITAYSSESLKGEAMVGLSIDHANVHVHSVTPAQLMDLATGAATVAAKMDPDNFDDLWAKLKASIVEARTPPMTDADWDKALRCDQRNLQALPRPVGVTEEEYMDGLTPRMEEDRTADVCNAREDEHLNKP
jgi:hypothetical protein